MTSETPASGQQPQSGSATAYDAVPQGHKPLDYDEDQGALVCQMHGIEDCCQNPECHEARNFRWANLVEAAGSTLCQCPYCGSLDVSYLGYDGLDICASCKHPFRCRQDVDE